MAESSDIAPLIAGLSDPESANRTIAAAILFERGSENVRTIEQVWLAFPPLADVLERDAALNGFKLTVGIAVEPKSFERIRAANASPRLADVPPDQDAREFELEFPAGVRLDILTTRQPGGDGAISRYLQKFGEGIQQIEISVSSVDRATEILREHFAIQPIYPATRAGADGTRVNFFLFPATDRKKVLIEFVEKR
jgi:hypothetical protein